MLEEVNEMSNAPASSLTCEDINTLLDRLKPSLATIECDVRDGKKRVSNVKAPSKRKGGGGNDEPPNESSGEEVGSGDD